jgi:hypothetical protein
VLGLGLLLLSTIFSFGSTSWGASCCGVSGRGQLLTLLSKLASLSCCSACISMTSHKHSDHPAFGVSSITRRKAQYSVPDGNRVIPHPPGLRANAHLCWCHLVR